MPEIRLITGINAVKEALLSPTGVECLFIEQSIHSPRLFEILKLARKLRIPVSLVPENKLRQIAGADHQGVVIRTPVKEYATLDKILQNASDHCEPPLIIIPEGVEDPQNLGALIRTALCAGAHGVLIPMTGSAGLTPGTERASAGALSYMDICREKSMPFAIATLKDQGVHLVGLEADEGPALWDVDLTGPLALILGGENRGIRPHIRRELDVLAHLPCQGSVGSLNVSAAAAAAVYEALRQRRKK